ncbi:alanine--tRNA ligase-related protein [Staphylococcus aureus]
MEPYYPNVKEKADFIKRVISLKIELFHQTLEDGLAILNELIKAKATTNEINGKDALKLYDTYAVPI